MLYYLTQWVQHTKYSMAHRNCLNVTRVSSMIQASIGFLIIVLLVFEFRDELSAVLWLADAVYELRTVACKDTEDLQWRLGYVCHYPVFLTSWITWSDWERRCQSAGVECFELVPPVVYLGVRFPLLDAARSSDSSIPACLCAFTKFVRMCQSTPHCRPFRLVPTPPFLILTPRFKFARAFSLVSS
jgi:hypothetical protein